MSRLSTFNSDQRGVVDFLSRCLLFTTPLIVVVVLLEMAIYRTGDTWPISKVIATEDRLDQFLYRPGYFSQQFNVYKYAVIKKRDPEILILGSSRVMKIRDFVFHPMEARFYNAGGLLQNLSDLVEYAERVHTGDLPKPSVAIIGIDPWWLKPASSGESSWLTDAALRDDALTPAAHVDVVRGFIRNRSFPWKETRSGALAPSPYYGHAAIGSFAIRYGVGFRRDGSRQEMPRTILESVVHPEYVDREDPTIIDRIENATRQFSPPALVDPSRVALLIVTLKKLRDDGVEVYPFLPPFADQCATALDNSEILSNWWHEYRDRLPLMLARNGFRCGHYRRPQDYGLNDSYMFDGWHASEVFMSYVMRDIVLLADEPSLLTEVELSHIDDLLDKPDLIPLSFTVPPQSEGMN